MTTKTPVFSCYEIRQIWGEGCPNPGCPLAATSPPVPCRHWAKLTQQEAPTEPPPEIVPGQQPKRGRPRKPRKEP